MPRKKATTRKKSSSKKTRKSSTARTTSRRKKTTGRKKTPRKKATRKKSSRKYGPLAGKKVKRNMDEMKSGKLKSGRSGKRVTSRKQAIAIALSEARRAGGKVPKTRKRS